MPRTGRVMLRQWWTDEERWLLIIADSRIDENFGRAPCSSKIERKWVNPADISRESDVMRIAITYAAASLSFKAPCTARRPAALQASVRHASALRYRAGRSSPPAALWLATVTLASASRRTFTHTLNLRMSNVRCLLGRPKFALASKILIICK